MTGQRWTPERVRIPVAAWTARARLVAAGRPDAAKLAVVGGGLAVVVLVAFVACSGPEVVPPPALAAPPPVATTRAGVPASPSAPPAPPRVTDGCHGLITAGQVSKATGLAVTGAGGDVEAAVGGYADAARAQGLDATVRLCPFASAAGDQVHVVALTFPDTAQANRMYASSQVGQAGSQPVAGVGDAALTDGLQTLLAKRGRSVLVVYLIRVRPAGDGVGALRAVALEALAKV